MEDEPMSVFGCFERKAPRWVAARIAVLALAGEYAGIERFMEIADRMEKLMCPDVIQ